MAKARIFTDAEVYKLWHKLFKLFDYIDGQLVYKADGKNMTVGQVAGCLNGHGYHRIVIDDVEYRRYQLVWLMFTGRLVPGLDHRDGIRDNDRLDNLRIATGSQNNANRKVSSNNTSGVTGVREIQPGRWTARIKVEGKIICLGTGTFQEAVELRRAAERKYFGEFAR